jgi:Glycosyl hydrolase family 47
VCFIACQAADVSVFEVNIRFVGGLLACYALTGDTVMFLMFITVLVLMYCAAVH